MIQILGVVHLDVDGLTLSLLAVDLLGHRLYALSLRQMGGVYLAASIAILLSVHSRSSIPDSHSYPDLVWDSVIVISLILIRLL